MEADKVRQSAEAGLKTTKRQIEDQRQKLHIIEINLTIEKQSVLDLKAELQKTMDAAWVARDAAEAAVKVAYERGVMDTEKRLMEEVAVVCRDYCAESWGVALDRAGVPANSKLRRAENVFFPEDIREILESDPLFGQLFPTQAPLPDAEVPEGAGVGKEA